MEKIKKINGELFIYENKKLIRCTDNLIVTCGINLILDRIIGESAEYITHWCIGSGVTPPDMADIDLQNPSASGRVAITTVSRSNNIITVTGQAGASTYNETWSEFGLFFADTGTSKIFNRAVFEPYSKASGTVIDWIYKISL